MRTLSFIAAAIPFLLLALLIAAVIHKPATLAHGESVPVRTVTVTHHPTAALAPVAEHTPAVTARDRHPRS